MDSKEDMDYLRVFVFKCTRTDELDFQRAIKINNTFSDVAGLKSSGCVHFRCDSCVLLGCC